MRACDQNVVLVEVSARGEEAPVVGVWIKLGDQYLKMSLKRHEDRTSVFCLVQVL